MNHFMYISCMLIWGLNFIAVKIQGTYASLEISLLYRSIIALCLFFILFIIQRKHLASLKGNIGTIVGFGLCNFAISYLLLYYGTILTTSALVTLIFSMKVVTTPLLISVILKQKTSGKIYIGGAFGILSVIITLIPQLHHLSSDFLLGGVLAILGTCITSLGDVFSLYNSDKNIDPVFANTMGMFAAVMLLLIFSIVSGQSFTFPTQPTYWLGLGYLAVLASFVAWLFYLKLVKNIGASKSSYMVAGFPAIGGIASVIIGESQLTIYLIFGIIFAVLGAYIALSKERQSA
ncbi:DMT family transporter [Staphylococcus americanisciuri]|uniref:DMT family transporter n=1 Tax=Staphylococcus americanisciuri TaxID=2973940 RepID=A0ABT2F195_9STAP|nr:DMT family transporter [Staphylococcus americanisciuri]MCS4485923.1 DMT family transporter [Staphylococcus americanisciuri]